MRPFILAAAPLAALVLTPAWANDDKAPAATTSQQEADKEPKPAEKTTEPPVQAAPEVAAPKAQEEKRICRRIRADASSRRKTKVCMTADQWREANQGG